MKGSMNTTRALKLHKETIRILRRDNKIITSVSVIMSVILASLAIFHIWSVSSLVSEVNHWKIEYATLRGNSSDYPYLRSAVFNFSELNQSEAKFVSDIMEELNPLYLIPQKEIHFVHNITPYCEDASKEGSTIDCGGINYFGSGIMYILYYEDVDWIRESTCHELLHTVMLNPFSNDPYEDPLHALVYQMAENQICFKKGGEKYLKHARYKIPEYEFEY